MYRTLSEHKCRRSPISLLFIFDFCAMAYGLPDSAWAETWVCPRKGQSDLYTDREFPGCRQLGETKTYSSLEISVLPGFPWVG